MKRTLKFLASSIASTGSLTLPLAVLAQNPSPFTEAQNKLDSVAGAANVEQGQDLTVTIGNIINVVLGFLGILLLAYILFAGFLWMTAGGDDDKVATAKTMIKNAIIGLIIIVVAFAISNFVITQLANVAGVA